MLSGENIARFATVLGRLLTISSVNARAGRNACAMLTVDALCAHVNLVVLRPRNLGHVINDRAYLVGCVLNYNRGTHYSSIQI